MAFIRYWDITDTSLKCTVTGSEFIFKGIQRSINEIKSTEGIDRCWVEEAQSVTAEAWEILIPTIRKENSEIWISFNPDLEEDPTYRTFVTYPQPNSLIRTVNFRDNPWFPQNLDKKRLHMLATDPETYRNVWEGRMSEASIPTRSGRKMSLKAAVSQPGVRRMREPPSWILFNASLLRSIRPGCSGKDDERSDEVGIAVAGIGHDGGFGSPYWPI